MSVRLPVPFEIEVICSQSGNVTLSEKRVFHRKMEVGVMEIRKVQSLCTRQFNKWLKHYKDDRSVIVLARFHGQMSEPPYSMHSGVLSGVGGKLMARRGRYDLD